MARHLYIAGTDRIAYAQSKTIKARQQSSGTSALDFTLIDPSFSVALGATVTLKEDTTTLWTGTVNSVRTKDHLTTGRYVSVTASNTTSASIVAASFGLSDAPDNSTTYGYKDLNVETTRESSGDVTRVTLTMYQYGLSAGNIVQITNALHAWTAQEFSLNEIQTEYDAGRNPVYKLTLGDPKVKLSTWIAGQAQDIADAEFPIDSTKINDGAVTTPKLAANSVTAEKVAAGSITTEKLVVTQDRSNLLLNGGFEDGYTGTPGTYDSTSKIAGWVHGAAGVSSTVGTSVNATGSYAAFVKGDGVATVQGLAQRIPVQQGRTYRLSGRAWKGAAGGAAVQILAHAKAADGTNVAFNVMVPVSHTTTTATFGEKYYTVPSGVAFLDVYCRFGTTPASSEVFAFDDVALEVVPAGAKNTPAEVVINDSGLTVTNGAITVANAGATVIIDGTSDMFKISAAGSYQTSVAANTMGTSGHVTLSGLGTQTQTPAYLTFLQTGTSSNTANRHLSVILDGTSPTLLWAAGTSGGSPNQRFVSIQAFAEAHCHISSSTIEVETSMYNQTGSTVIFQTKYFVLAESAI